MPVMQRNQFLDFFSVDKLPELAAVIVAKSESYPSMKDQLFNEHPISTDIVQHTTLSGLRNPVIVPEGSAIPSQSIQPGFDRTYTVDKVATSFSITKEMRDDQKFNFIQRGVESFSKGMFEAKEISLSNVFNNGFTTAGPDGQALFSTAHPLENGGGQTGSNRGTTAALSVTSFRALRNLFQDTLNENGQRSRYMMQYLVCPQELQDIGMELIKSQYHPENANNAVNTIYGSVQLLPNGYWPYLTSATAFFIVSRKEDHSLYFINRQSMQVDSDYDKRTQTWDFFADERYTQGFSGWRGTAGNSGA